MCTTNAAAKNYGGHQLIPVPLKWPAQSYYDGTETYACQRCDGLIVAVDK